jgi:hypothetical protein
VVGDGGYYVPRSFIAVEDVGADQPVLGPWGIQGSSNAYDLQNPTVAIVAPRATGDYQCSSTQYVLHAAHPYEIAPAYLWRSTGQACDISIELGDGTVSGTASGTLTRAYATIPYTIEFFVPDYGW